MHLPPLLRRAAGPFALSVAAAVLTPRVARADLTFTISGADFSGTTDNTGGNITVLIHDVSSGKVQLTITNNLVDPGAFMSELDLNTLATNLATSTNSGSCVANCANINNTTPGFGFGSDAFKADGVGGLFDIQVLFSTPSADRLTPGNSVTLQLNSTASGFNAASFNTSSTPSGGSGDSFLVAAHIQNLPNNGAGSDWLAGTVTSTPEPSSVILMATGLLGLAARRRNMKTNAA